eukprot:355590-Chlamydomonas_euryale.AAC.2
MHTNACAGPTDATDKDWPTCRHLALEWLQYSASLISCSTCLIRLISASQCQWLTWNVAIFQRWIPTSSRHSFRSSSNTTLLTMLLNFYTVRLKRSLSLQRTTRH